MKFKYLIPIIGFWYCFDELTQPYPERPSWIPVGLVFYQCVWILGLINFFVI